MARAAVAALLTALPLVSAAKDPNSIVFASFGDWGWSTTGGQNVILTGSGSSIGGTICANYSLANYAANVSGYTAACFDGEKVQQGSLIVAGLQQVAQIATANAMAAACSAAGSCDFIINTGCGAALQRAQHARTRQQHARRRPHATRSRVSPGFVPFFVQR